MKLKNIYGFMVFLTVLAAGLLPAFGQGGINDGFTSNTATNSPCATGSNSGSVNLVIPCGQLAHGSVVSTAQLLIEEHQPSAMLATPQVLHLIIGDYSMSSVRTLSDGAREIDVVKIGGTLMYFKVASGSSTGNPVDSSVGAKEYVTVVNDGSDVYYDLYDGNGNRYRFLGTDDTSDDYLTLVNITISGRTQTLSEMGVSVIKTSGQLDQIKTPSRLLDIEVDSDSRYHIDIHSTKVLGAPDGTTGLYATSGLIPIQSWVVENPDPNNINELHITDRIGTYNAQNQTYETERTAIYTYNVSRDEWTLTKDGDTFNRYSHELAPAQDEKVHTRVIGQGYGGTERIQYKKTTTDRIYDWGAPVVREEEFSASGTSIVTTYTYYTDPGDNGYRKKASMSRSDGYWERYEYNSDDLLSRKIMPFKDSPEGAAENEARVIQTAYVLVGTAHRPQSIEETVLGQMVKLTGYAYPVTGDGERQEIKTEYLPTSGTVVSSITTKTYYKPNPTAAEIALGASGERLKSIEYPDGRMDTYTYYQGNYPDETQYTVILPKDRGFTANTAGTAWQEIVTHGTVAAQNGIVGKTTRDVAVWDVYGNEVLRQTEVYAGNGIYERIDWEVSEYDDLNHPVLITYSDGTTATGEWGTGCCGKDNGFDRNGIYTTYAYDAYKRIDSSARSGVATSYTYDGKGRRLTTTSTGGSLSQDTAATYDWRGRVLTSTDERGLVTSTVYNDAARTATTTLPGDGTRIVTKYVDGEVRSITGTAVVPTFINRAIDHWGNLYTQTHTGSSDNSSPRWVKTAYDKLGRVVYVEKPSYVSGIRLQTQNVYNDVTGRLEMTLRREPSGPSGPILSRTIYEYDTLGNLTRAGLDANNDGTLTLASMDRITDYDRSYQEETIGTDDIWFLTETTTTYPTDNSDTAQTLSVRKTQLTGLGTVGGTHGTLVAKTTIKDVYGQDTVNSTYVMLDDDNTGGVNEQKVTQVTNVPTSTQDAIVVYRGDRKASQTSTTGVETALVYDGLGRLYSKTVNSSADGAPGDERTVSSTYAYYANGVGAKGQLQMITENVAGTTGYDVGYTYHADTGLKHTESRMATLSDSSSQTITTTYTYHDYTGRLKRVEGGQYPVEYDYNVYGQMNSLKTWRDEDVAASFVETTWEYHPATGLLEHKRYDNEDGTGKGPDYTYYADGKLQTRAWARQITDWEGVTMNLVPVTATYSYNAVTRVLEGISYNDATPTDAGTLDITYANHDRFGRLRSVTDGQGSRTLSYTDSGQSDLESISGSFSVDREFDAYGRPEGFVLNPVSPSQTIAYGYDGLGRFETANFTIDGKSDTLTYVWADGVDLLTGYTSADSTPGLDVGYVYENNRDLKTDVVNKAVVGGAGDPALVSQYVYLYDEVGRRKQRTDTIGGYSQYNSFKYNERSEVVTADMDLPAGNRTYTYDDIGNRKEVKPISSTATTYTPNNLNQYTAVGGTTFNYDDDGNLTDDGIWRYVWNAENRLVQMRTFHNPDTPAVDDLKLEFKYDFMGRRYEKKVYSYNTSTSNFELQSSNSFVYDGWNMIRELQTGNQQQSTSTKSYVWGLDLSQTLQGAGGVGGLLATVISDGTAAAYYPTADANGNITGYVNESGGIVARFQYDDFGRVVDETGTQKDDFNFRFSSKYEDTETDLNYYGFRYYSAELGRWLNRDPIEEKGGVNLYVNCFNNCLGLVDYNGHETWTSDCSTEGLTFFFGMVVMTCDLYSPCRKIDSSDCCYEDTAMLYTRMFGASLGFDYGIELGSGITSFNVPDKSTGNAFSGTASLRKAFSYAVGQLSATIAVDLTVGEATSTATFITSNTGGFAIDVSIVAAYAGRANITNQKRTKCDCE